MMLDPSKNTEETFQPQTLFEYVAVPDSPETESSHNQTEILRRNQSLLVPKAAAVAKMSTAPLAAAGTPVEFS